MTLPASCPIPLHDYPVVTLAHGGGGRLMRSLVNRMFAIAHDNEWMREQHDAAILADPSCRLAFTTDSFVVSPLFFPGADIGKLAVCGTVNDLACAGATPRHLSCGFIIEEGLPMETLWRVVVSMRQAADEAGVQVVTGDTKVVDRGKADGLFINTAGIGTIDHDLDVRPSSIRAGDVVLLSGDVGRHGLAVMAEREGLRFESDIRSDCAPIAGAVGALLRDGIELHCVRDLTRGGLASAIVEIAESTQLDVQLDETAIPVRGDVAGACEILGFDPLYVANEGRFVAFVPEAQAERALEILRAELPPDARELGPSRIGDVKQGRGLASLTSTIGATRALDLLSGEQLPRIC